jgi:hypothetical protein
MSAAGGGSGRGRHAPAAMPPPDRARVPVVHAGMSGTDARQASTASTILHGGDPRWFHGEYRRPNDVDAVSAAMRGLG